METEQRFERLEFFADETKQRLTRIETRLEEMATKADLFALEARLIKWMIATAFAITTVMGGVAVAVAKLIH
ncbi:hypothetical protein [Duganella sp.]|uniref:hypothetical protein n=1 Tax=Duganella sp. TaxID=1904440 RepID=UPI0031D9CCCF